ncbi:unnamed protein product [Pieris brassicae]|uniref:Protein kinase domain-containing protein n=1 Tax=Pieris brassicae TaxID=7116 RepID=A0A9P0XF75_PIEBR|nr:unnamed protein product [Pieris brassicae]
MFSKVIDFGSSCYEHQRVYTYIQSRFYRAPEVMMGAKYGMPIDMWSLGCILAELLTGFPLLPGEDEADQMACIIELLGMPPQRLIEQGKRSKNFISSKGLPRYCTATTLPDGTTVLSGGMSRRGKPRGLPGSKSFVTALKGCQDKYFIDFIRRCLEWEPEKRLTPAQALRHAWLRRRLPRPPHDEEPNHSTSVSGGAGGTSVAGGAGAGGARGGSLRTPLARTPVTFNASQVAKAKLQAALSEEGSGRPPAQRRLAKVSSLEAPRRAVPGPTRLDLERRSLDLERELRVDRDSDASLDDRDHLV